jgi:hypothetical protein
VSDRATRTAASSTAADVHLDDAACRARLVAEHPHLAMVEMLTHLDQDIAAVQRLGTGMPSGVITGLDNRLADVVAHGQAHGDVLLRHVLQQVPASSVVAYGLRSPAGDSVGLLMAEAVGRGLLPDEGLVDRHVRSTTAYAALACGLFQRVAADRNPSPLSIATAAAWVHLPHTSRVRLKYSKAICERMRKIPAAVAGLFMSASNISYGLEYGAHLASRGLIPAATILDWAATAVHHRRSFPSPTTWGLIEACVRVVPPAERAQQPALRGLCVTTLAHDGNPQELMLSQSDRQVIKDRCTRVLAACS